MGLSGRTVSKPRRLGLGEAPPTLVFWGRRHCVLLGFTHRPLSSSFLGLPYRILIKELRIRASGLQTKKPFDGLVCSAGFRMGFRWFSGAVEAAVHTHHPNRKARIIPSEA